MKEKYETKGGGAGYEKKKRKKKKERNMSVSKENELNWVFGFASTVSSERRCIPRRKYQTI